MRQRRPLCAVLSCALFFFLCYLIFDITDPSIVMTLFRPDRFPVYADLTLTPGADILDILQNQTNPTLVFRNLVGNVLLFAPVGFLAPLLWPYWRKFGRALALGAGLSLTIELLQLCNVRATVTDDFLLNTLGAVLGYCCFALLARLTGRLQPGEEGRWTPVGTAAAALALYNLVSIAQYIRYVIM